MIRRQFIFIVIALLCLVHGTRDLRQAKGSNASKSKASKRSRRKQRKKERPERQLPSQETSTSDRSNIEQQTTSTTFAPRAVQTLILHPQTTELNEATTNTQIAATTKVAEAEEGENPVIETPTTKVAIAGEKEETSPREEPVRASRVEIKPAVTQGEVEDAAVTATQTTETDPDDTRTEEEKQSTGGNSASSIAAVVITVIFIGNFALGVFVWRKRKTIAASSENTSEKDYYVSQNNSIVRDGSEWSVASSVENLSVTELPDDPAASAEVPDAIRTSVENEIVRIDVDSIILYDETSEVNV